MNKLNKSIFESLETTKSSNVPFLLLGNPGYGKTTTIKIWANENGYNLTQIIAGRYQPEELLGYQVNEPGSEYLTYKKPFWYKSIQNNEKSILFFDEIASCSPYVKGALLSLIFDRELSDGTKLPENTLIIAAANYSGNIDSCFNLDSPTLNRFAILNLLDGFTNEDLMEVLTEDISTLKPETIEKIELNDFQKTLFNEEMLKFKRNLFVRYSDPSSAYGLIDIQNKMINNIFEQEGNIYNFISVRTLGYLNSVVKAYIENNLNDDNFLKQCINGLIGAGSNNFDEKQLIGYQQSIFVQIKSIIEKVKNNVKKVDNAKKYTKATSLHEAATNIINSTDNSNMLENIDSMTKDLELNLKKYISGNFKLPENEEQVIEYNSDIQSCFQLLNKNMSIYSDKIDLIKNVISTHLYYFCGLRGEKVNFNDYPNLEKIDEFDSCILANVRAIGKCWLTLSGNKMYVTISGYNGTTKNKEVSTSDLISIYKVVKGNIKEAKF